MGAKVVWIFNIHQDEEADQPDQLLGLEYGPAQSHPGAIPPFSTGRPER